MTCRLRDFQAEQPAFAATVRERFGRYRHHVLATSRPDGSPRLSGLEAGLGDGELWLGMMPGSLKAQDLRRDPRFSVHANPGPGTDMDGGDVRISGRAVEITDTGALARYARDLAERGAEGPPPGGFHLFRAELGEVVRVRVEEPDIVIEVWRPGRGLRTIRRGNEEGTVREER